MAVCSDKRRELTITVCEERQLHVTSAESQCLYLAATARGGDGEVSPLSDVISMLSPEPIRELLTCWNWIVWVKQSDGSPSQGWWEQRNAERERTANVQQPLLGCFWYKHTASHCRSNSHRLSVLHSSVKTQTVQPAGTQCKLLNQHIITFLDGILNVYPFTEVTDHTLVH